MKEGIYIKKTQLNINPYTFTGSAVAIGLVLANELNALEQSSVGNWLQLMGLTIQTYSSQQAVINDNNNNSNDETDIETIKKAINKLKEELEKLQEE